MNIFYDTVPLHNYQELAWQKGYEPQDWVTEPGPRKTLTASEKESRRKARKDAKKARKQSHK